MRTGNKTKILPHHAHAHKRTTTHTHTHMDTPQYLGDLEEEGRATMEDEETTPTLPLLCIPGRVLFPGETLPMHIYNPQVS